MALKRGIRDEKREAIGGALAYGGALRLVVGPDGSFRQADDAPAAAAPPPGDDGPPGDGGSEQPASSD